MDGGWDELYLVQEAFQTGFYPRSEFLWVAPICVALWMLRIWFMAHRGELDDDPVAFALKDRISHGLGIAIVIGFVGASL